MAKPRSSRKWTATSVPRTSAAAPASNAGSGIVSPSRWTCWSDTENVVTGLWQRIVSEGEPV